MLFTFRLPSNIKLSQLFLEHDIHSLGFNYTERHKTLRAEKVKGYDNDALSGVIGYGEAAFAEAKTMLIQWQMFPAKWTKIFSESDDVQVGTNVILYAKFLGVWWKNTSRVVYIIDEPNRFGFAYGTLTKHLEKGEELFLLEINDKNELIYTIKAFSTPYHWIAKLCYPIMRYLQGKFRKDSLMQMKQLLHYK